MKKLKINYLTSAAVVLFFVIACSQYKHRVEPNHISVKEKNLAYRNAVNPVPDDYNGPIFELQYDYPNSLSLADLEEQKWLSIPVSFDRPPAEDKGKWSKEWVAYSNAVKTYLMANIGLSETGYTLKKSWYNLPWLAADPHTGREFTHGARYSFNIPLTQIDPRFPESDKVAVWGIANYNSFGAYAIGKMWSDTGDLNINPMDTDRLDGLPFPEGTVIHKINMIGHLGDYYKSSQWDGPPHLKGAPTWTLNLHKKIPDGDDPSVERSLQEAYVLEMDVMVKDSRAPMGWVFMALVYDETIPRDSPMWERYAIMGLQFGMDPETSPAVEKSKSKPIYQTLLNPISNNWTVGCEGRLATFQGTTNQNCAGCHQTAAFYQAAPDKAARAYSLTYGIQCGTDEIYPFYFQNWKYGEVFSAKPNTESATIYQLDYSLRIYDSIQAYFTYKSQ